MRKPESARSVLSNRDRLLALAGVTGALAISFLFGWLVLDIIIGGIGALQWQFIVDNPQSAGRAGGIGPVVVSTLLILAVCMVICLPVSLATAVYLADKSAGDAGDGRWLRRSLDVLAGVPSIVFGLFGAALFCELLGLGYSILAGGLTLACMVLPFMIRAAEASLRAIPASVSLGGYALGFSRYGLLLRVLIPVAMPGLTVALILGIGRALAETAALIFTSGYVLRMPDSLLDSGRTLSVHIYDLAMNVAGGETNAYRSALILILLLIAINGAAHLLTRRFRQEVQFT